MPSKSSLSLRDQLLTGLSFAFVDHSFAKAASGIFNAIDDSANLVHVRTKMRVDRPSRGCFPSPNRVAVPVREDVVGTWVCDDVFWCDNCATCTKLTAFVFNAAVFFDIHDILQWLATH